MSSAAAADGISSNSTRVRVARFLQILHTKCRSVPFPLPDIIVGRLPVQVCDRVPVRRERTKDRAAELESDEWER